VSGAIFLVSASITNAQDMQPRAQPSARATLKDDANASVIQHGHVIRRGDYGHTKRGRGATTSDPVRLRSSIQPLFQTLMQRPRPSQSGEAGHAAELHRCTPSGIDLLIRTLRRLLPCQGVGLAPISHPSAPSST